MGSAGDGTHGRMAVDEHLLWASRLYREHLELVYPFFGFGVLSLLLELRFELLFDLFDIDRSFRVTAETDPLRELLSAPVADAVAPVLEEIFLLFVIGLLFLFGLTFVAFLFVAGIAFLLAADSYRDDSRSQTTRAIVSLKRLPALFVASLVGGTGIAVGTVLFVLPGLYLASRLALGGPAIVVGGYGPLSGLRESWQRTEPQQLDVGILAIGGAVLVTVAGFIPLLGEALAVLVVLPLVLLTLGKLYVQQE